MNDLTWINQYNDEHGNEYANYVISGKYLAIFKPYHHKARKDGYVYIHQLQAEKKLNRPLRDAECVHRTDKNKFNNDVDNLLVFHSKSDHTAFHNGRPIYCIQDVWFADMSEQNKHEICPICNLNKKDRYAKMCIDCYLKEKSKNSNIPKKDNLIELLIKYPIVKIAKIFNVSDNAVRKWCKKYKLPYKKNDIEIFKQQFEMS